MIRRMILTIALLALPVTAIAGGKEAENKKNCARFYEEVVNQGKLGLIEELMSKDFVEHEQFPGLSSGREGVREFFAMMRAAFPDLRFDIEMMLADGDKVVTYLTMSGTHRGEFMGMPATGNRFETRTIDIVRFENGKAVEHWGVTDVATMMEQLQAAKG